MAKVPEALERKQHVELAGPDLEAWLRRIGLFLLAAFIAVGLANVSGRRPAKRAWRATSRG